MKAFVQRKKNGDFPNINFAIAYDGLDKMGFEIINYYDIKQIDEIKKEDLFIGFVKDTKQILNNLQVSIPEISCYPEELKDYYGRVIWKNTLQQFITEEKYNIFIKPVENKFFTGKLIRSFKDFISIGHQKEKVDIWCSEPINIVTEYRCFIRYGTIIDLRRYKGDWRLKPDVTLIEEAVKKISDKLSGYAIDFGITKEGKTVVIELNDGYSLGNYGLFSVDYCRLLIARWSQIMNTEDMLKI